MGGIHSCRTAFFLAFPPRWGETNLEHGIWHPTPARQFGTVLQGHVVNYASDGTTLDMKPGDILLMEDLAPAHGHITINVSAEEPCLAYIVQW